MAVSCTQIGLDKFILCNTVLIFKFVDDFFYRKMIGRIVFKSLYVIFSVLGSTVGVLVNLIFSKIYDGEAKTVPKVEDKILLLSATELSRQIRSRQVQNMFN